MSVGSEFSIVMNLKHFIQNKYLDSQTLQHVTMFYILTGTLPRMIANFSQEILMIKVTSQTSDIQFSESMEVKC